MHKIGLVGFSLLEYSFLKSRRMFKYLFLLLPCILFASSDHVVTYQKGCRLGDNLLCYLHTKWISHQHNLPLRYKRFKHSSFLVLHDKELHLNKDPKKDTRLTHVIENGMIDLDKENPTMFVCPYFPESADEKAYYNHFDVDWKNEEFRRIAKEMIAPKKRFRLVKPPKKTCVTIAIHVREGGGYDPESTRIDSPLKLPPMSFYLRALSDLIPLFPDQKIYCHVFTDAMDTQKIVEQLKSVVPANTSIEFKYRKSGNSHKKNVLVDFFSLFNFDILVRPESNFSMVPSLIHDFAITYSPVKASVQGDHVVIEETNMEINEELYQKLLLRKSSPSNWFADLKNSILNLLK